MVSWNDKVAGAKLTGDEPLLGLYLGCLACQHTARVRMSEVPKIWPIGTTARDIARSLKCVRCGERRGYVQVISDARPAGAPRNGYWGPGPAYPEVTAEGLKRG